MTTLTQPIGAVSHRKKKRKKEKSINGWINKPDYPDTHFVKLSSRQVKILAG